MTRERLPKGCLRSDLHDTRERRKLKSYNLNHAKVNTGSADLIFYLEKVCPVGFKNRAQFYALDSRIPMVFSKDNCATLFLMTVLIGKHDHL